MKELDHLNKFLISIKKKLDNNKFISNAPKKVIDMERKKENDTKEKIKITKIISPNADNHEISVKAYENWKNQLINNII